MDVFDLDARLIAQYEAFARSFTKIRSTDLSAKVDEFYAARKFWPEPLIQLNPHYAGGKSVAELVGAGGLAAETAAIFRDLRNPGGADPSLKLRRHQEQAIGSALSGKSYVVTTGTGSGKSLCFFIPIIDAVVKAKKAGEGPRTRAIVIYPMNALANSQQEELRKFLDGNPGGIPVTFARYTGQESQEEREKVRNDPPDILLTNFMMLEMLMTRQNELDRKVIANCAGLRFIVLDELHTYRGRQGADVALLMRRLRARVANPAKPPICIGTSATMASGDENTDKLALVAGVASQLFGTAVSAASVISETLQRATDHARSADKGLGDLAAAVKDAAANPRYAGKANAEIAKDPLAIWVETRLGLANVESKPIRGRPQSLEDATHRLEADTKLPAAVCREALQSALLAFSLPENERGVSGGVSEPLFAFKLHQFIAGAHRLYATLDAPNARSVTCEGQIFDPDNPEKRLFPTHFCRACGHEHHPVRLVSDADGQHFEAREIDDVPVASEGDVEEAEVWGFLMPEPSDGEFTFEGRDEDYPDPWLEETPAGAVRLKSQYRSKRAQPYDVRADGTVGAGGRRFWFLPKRFNLCPACGDYHSDSTRDINRLASLSAEGRSSASTVLVAAILRWMQGPDARVPRLTRKLLSFTDNRQDAALQAGHFNDFIFVTLTRGAIFSALARAGAAGLTEDQLGLEIQKSLGFTAANTDRRCEWLYETGLMGASLLAAEKAMREAFSHRFWIDQRRGWRFTNPNLEQLGLVEAEYVSLEDMAADAKAFANADPILQNATTTERAAAARAILDYMRKGLAVECDALDRTRIDALTARMRGVIKAPWALEEERVRGATVLLPQAPLGRELSVADQELILRGSPQSALGRELRKLTFAGQHPNRAQIEAIVAGILEAASKYGLVAAVPSPVGDSTGYRLLPIGMLFKAGNKIGELGRTNAFFRDLYEEIARLLSAGGAALFGFEGREHTAQVDGELREIREARFRQTNEDLKLLKDKAETLRGLREDSRFLPVLFCSPTMELGVDISAMNVIYMRNMPPTPANYAQRSGRAGRSGQAALVVAYCAAQSPHDQYFFRKKIEMVAGVVEPPAIDLTNPDLVDSHLQAEWLAASGADLTASIKDNLDMARPEKPLLTALNDRIRAPATAAAATPRVEAVLAALANDYGASPPPWFAGVSAQAAKVIAAAPDKLDRAFTRWRDLLIAAERQVEEATRTLLDHTIGSVERRAAEARQSSGNTQLRLLLRPSEGQNSDFYVYRYLATEGFLPGYNFPRLPLIAFIPGDRDGKGERYLQRARFLAISEFGPRSLVYHEGRTYRVDRALLRDVGSGPDGMLATFSTSLCPACGADHDAAPPEECHVCRTPLAAAFILRDMYRIENVGTSRTLRITANDEERMRQGFDVQTSFSYRNASGRRARLFCDNGGTVATADYASSANVRRINKGLRRRANLGEIGFTIDPRNGRWTAAPDEDEAPDPNRVRQRITPVVEDRKNALLLRFPVEWLSALADRDKTLVTVQHALARGIETVYQLEEGEIMVEPTPGRGDRKALFFYESAEGGAGALARLTADADGMRRVAQAALSIMHFTPASIAEATSPESLVPVDGAACVAGCYHCLLSYFNQPDHATIDRKDPAALMLLLRLAAADLIEAEQPADGKGPKGCPPPDAEPIIVDGITVPLIWRRARIAALDGEMPARLAEKLGEKGIEVFPLPSDEPARRDAIARLAAALQAAP
jgi:hypothetical protein